MSQIAQPTASDRSLLPWFGGILALTVAFQIARLNQDHPAGWLAADYLMRGSVLVLIAISPVRRQVFSRGKIRVSLPQFLGWCFALGAGAVLLHLCAPFVADLVPRGQIGRLPKLSGVLSLVDLTFGVALVAVHEELFFRSFARIAFRTLGDGVAMIAVTAVIFGLYHWWTGLSNVLLCVAFGALFMAFYQRVGVLWPVMIVHYLIDFWILARYYD